MSDSQAGPIRPQTGEWPLMPTETEIYILPSGEIIVADLPAELAGAIARTGATPQAATPGDETGEAAHVAVEDQSSRPNNL